MLLWCNVQGIFNYFKLPLVRIYATITWLPMSTLLKITSFLRNKFQTIFSSATLLYKLSRCNKSFIMKVHHFTFLLSLVIFYLHYICTYLSYFLILSNLSSFFMNVLHFTIVFSSLILYLHYNYTYLSYFLILSNLSNHSWILLMYEMIYTKAPGALNFWNQCKTE